MRLGVKTAKRPGSFREKGIRRWRTGTCHRGTSATRRPETEMESRPVSRVLSWTVIHLGQASPPASSDLPGPGAGHTTRSLFGLAPGGVYPATPVTRSAVRSYRTFSPLPVKAVCFLWHFPSARAAQALPGTLPCGARTFLRRGKRAGTPFQHSGDCPAGSPGLNIRRACAGNKFTSGAARRPGGTVRSWFRHKFGKPLRPPAAAAGNPAIPEARRAHLLQHRHRHSPLRG